MILSWEFQLAFAKPYGQGLLHQWPGHSPNLNLFENWWRPIPFLILFHSYFNAFHLKPGPNHGSVWFRFGSVRFGFRAHYHYSGKTESWTKSQTESDNSYTAAQIKVLTLLDLITQLFLTRFLIFWYVSYRAWKMQAIDTKHIKIGQFV